MGGEKRNTWLIHPKDIGLFAPAVIVLLESIVVLHLKWAVLARGSHSHSQACRKTRTTHLQEKPKHTSFGTASINKTPHTRYRTSASAPARSRPPIQPNHPRLVIALIHGGQRAVPLLEAPKEERGVGVVRAVGEDVPRKAPLYRYGDVGEGFRHLKVFSF